MHLELLEVKISAVHNPHGHQTIFVTFLITKNKSLESMNLDAKHFHISLLTTHFLTSFPPVAMLLPDQNKWEQVATPRHWSGFLSSFEAANAHCVLKGSWFSSLKHDICSNVATISVIAASWALLSEISSSYSENAWKNKWVHIQFLFKSP